MSSSAMSDEALHDEAKAYALVESVLWPDGPVCPHCGTMDRASPMKGKSTRIGAYKCYACRKKFTVKIGTIFEDSHIPMRFWLQAIFLMASSKEGISSNQLHRTFGISLRSAWFMSHRLREAMRSGPLGPMGGGGSGVVEIDETIYGRASTHPKGRARDLAKRKITNSAHRNVILSLVERGGSVRSYHVAGSTTNEIIPIVNANVAKEAAVMTDSAQLYKYRLGDFASHDRIDHSKDEYARYEEGRPVIHTNTVEGYFSVFKRGMRGTYQHCKEKHLHRYLAEFDFRYNARVALGVNDKARAERLLRGVKGKRLTYR
ncbi:MAG: IS1595 family transposase [Hyphomicrobiaceae bacterium]